MLAVLALAVASCQPLAKTGLAAERPASDRPPNLVLIMCDDMGYSSIGCYGGEIQTPHLDKLAAEGLRFTQFYNNAKCTTTRASLVTGLYPRRGKGGLLRNNMVTLGEALKLAGYNTALSGKWHLGSDEGAHPFRRGFDEYYGLLDGCCNFFCPTQRDPPFKGGRIRTFGENDRKITEFPDDYYTTDAFTDHAIACVKKFSKEDKPFLLHVCYTAPHYPLHARPEDIEKYVGTYKRIGWEELRKQRHKRQIEMGLIDPKWELPPMENEVIPWDVAPHKDWQDLRMAVYAAMIDSMDQNIGRLLAALEETGERENTLILFLSDNGGCSEKPGGNDPRQIPGPKEYYAHCGPGWACAQNTPFRRYKSCTHEGGVATPLIAHWPGRIPPRGMTRDVAHIIDVMPTFLELAGGEYPKEHAGQGILPCEGKSMVPLLLGKQRESHEFLFWEWAGNRAVRSGDWKACWDNRRKQWELYNLPEDRTEMNDLADEQPDRTKRLAGAWTAWAKRTELGVGSG